MSKGRLVDYRDALHGFRLKKPPEWVVGVSAGTIWVVKPDIPLVSCGFQLAKAEGLREVLRAYLDYEERSFRALASSGVQISILGRWWSEQERGLAVRSLFKLAGPLIYMLGLGPQAYVEGYAFITGLKEGIFLTSSYTAPIAMKGALSDELVAILSSFELVEPIPSSLIALPDLERRMPAYVMKVPRGWQVVGGVRGLRLSADIADPEGSARIVIQPSAQYVYAEGPMAMSLALTGMPISPYVDALSYARSVLPSSGFHIEWARPDGLSAPTFSEFMGMMMAAPTTGLRPLASASLAKISGQELEGYAWIITAGLAMGGILSWSAQVDYALSTEARGAEDALSILRGIASSVVINPRWRERVFAEARARQRASAQMRAMIMRDVMSSIRHHREMFEMTRRTFDEIRQMRLEAWKADMRESLMDTHGWCNAVSGTIDVRDPATGEIYQVDDVAHDYWIDAGREVIVGTPAHEEPPQIPGVEWRKLEKSLRGFPEQFYFW